MSSSDTGVHTAGVIAAAPGVISEDTGHKVRCVDERRATLSLSFSFV
jgi:hypothetical protein